MGTFFRKTRSIMLILILTFTALLGSTAVHAEYGDEAYAFMQQLQSQYPHRAYRGGMAENTALNGARDWLLTQAHTMGYETMLQSFPVGDGGTADNIIFSRQGESDRVVVIGAHYDSVEQTFGADDNASGVGVLLELASRYRNETPPYTLRFILFSAEEPGCIGSKYYVSALPQEERDRIVCMINIDTVASGDYMYLYGGGIEQESIVRDWAVFQALADAELLGLEMSFHPDVNPIFPVPTKTTASDQMAFNDAGIPYVYCEASNWTQEPYTNFFQTENPAVIGNVVMHVPEYDNLTFITQTFGTRSYDHLKAYTKLLDYFIAHLEEGNYYAEYDFEETKRQATATGAVYLRGKPSRYSEALSLLEEGVSLTVIGYHASWCQVEANGQEGYIKTEYLELSEESASQEEISQETETQEFESQVSEGQESESQEPSSGAQQESQEQESQEQNSQEAAPQSTRPSTAPSEQSSQAVTGATASGSGLQPPTAQDKDVITLCKEWFQKQLEYNPMAVRIVLIAAIVILGIWMCVLIAIHQNKKEKQLEKKNPKKAVKPGEDNHEDLHQEAYASSAYEDSEEDYEADYDEDYDAEDPEMAEDAEEWTSEDADADYEDQ